jgi:hypothetical protein
MGRMVDDLTVTALGEERRVVPGETFTFGRAATCTACLDPDDGGISRLAGEIEFVGQVWFVTNRSRSRPLAVVDRFGLRSVLGPGQRSPVEGRVRVLVDGSRTSHELVLDGPEPESPPDGTATGASTLAGQGVVINDADRRALVALFAGYLQQGDRYDPAPRSYAAAAARLQWERTTLVKRIEYLRTRLTNAGVPNLQGWNAMQALAEYVLTTGIITPDDLHLIGQ